MDGLISILELNMSRMAKELLIEALSMGKSRIPKRTKERAASGLCVIQGCDCQAVGRGLCVKHKNEFYYRLARIRTKVAQLEFEQAAIRRGLVLPVGTQLEIKRDKSSVFAMDSESA